MGTFAPDDFGNFANEGALDYLSMLTARLVGTITEVCADEERLAADEDGETLLMPSVEVLALLCERYGAAPPRPATVRQWRDKYLAAFDRGIDRLRPAAEFKAERRRVIETTFRWLGSVAQTHWQK